jgi:hypothetical protein
MIRILAAVGGTAIVFAAALIIGGELFGAWEQAKPVATPRAEADRARGLVAVESPSAKPRAHKPARRSAARPRRPKRTARSRPAWVAKLNALCRSAEAETRALPRPRTPAEVTPYLRRIATLSERWNRRAASQLALAGRPYSKSVGQLLGLFEEERGLIADAIAAAEARDGARFELLAPMFLANGSEQSGLLVGLGARDCTLPADLQL